jgi:hypothetical protein
MAGERLLLLEVAVPDIGRANGCILLPVSAVAEAGAPLDTVQSAVASIIAIVGRPDLQGSANLVARRALLRSAADDFFDFPEMAQRSLGYHRATPSERERAEFVALFRGLLERSYMRRSRPTPARRSSISVRRSRAITRRCARRS